MCLFGRNKFNTDSHLYNAIKCLSFSPQKPLSCKKITMMTLEARKLELIQLLAAEKRPSVLDMVEQALRTDVSDNDQFC